MLEKQLNDEWVDFGEVAHEMCGMQSQYCSRYVDGRFGYPHLGADLRFRNYSPTLGITKLYAGDYHSIQIHRDDAEEFARRVNDHRVQTHQIAEAPKRFSL